MFWIDETIERYPVLASVRTALEEMVNRTVEMYRNAGTFFVAGNGGSAADADHICGELLKGFKSLRPFSDEELEVWEKLFGSEAKEKAAKLQKGLRAVSLLSHPGFISAFGNDVDGSLSFAQLSECSRAHSQNSPPKLWLLAILFRVPRSNSHG